MPSRSPPSGRRRKLNGLRSPQTVQSTGTVPNETTAGLRDIPSRRKMRRFCTGTETRSIFPTMQSALHRRRRTKIKRSHLASPIWDCSFTSRWMHVGLRNGMSVMLSSLPPPKCPLRASERKPPRLKSACHLKRSEFLKDGCGSFHSGKNSLILCAGGAHGEAMVLRRASLGIVSCAVRLQAAFEVTWP